MGVVFLPETIYISISIMCTWLNKCCCYQSWHLPSASPTRILSPRLMQNLNSNEESPSSTDFDDMGAWKTSTTVDPMLKAAT